MTFQYLIASTYLWVACISVLAIILNYRIFKAKRPLYRIGLSLLIGLATMIHPAMGLVLTLINLTMSRRAPK